MRVSRIGCFLVVVVVATATIRAPSLDAQERGKKGDGKKSSAASATPGSATPGSGAKVDSNAKAEGAGAPDSAQKFDAKLAEWKTVLKELRALKVKYQTAPEAEFPVILEQWNKLMVKGEKLAPELREAGQAAYIAAPNADRQLQRFLLKLVEDDIARDNYEPALELARVLIENGCDQTDIYASAGIAAFVTSNLDKAAEYMKLARDSGPIADAIKNYPKEVQAIVTYPQKLLDDYQNFWAKEQELRAAEAEKNDLPRVRLKTSKGDIVIELFENEAPETVGNIVNLVEKKFYDGLTFHRVLPGFMAQGGCPKGDGSGSPGYEIYDEAKKENARQHFRGSLSMAKSNRPDSGGSQFFLTFTPTPHLNGVHTVFGRVLEGMDVLAKIQRRNPEDKVKPEPDKIITAEVIRKRDHAYAPNKVQ